MNQAHVRSQNARESSFSFEASWFNNYSFPNLFSGDGELRFIESTCINVAYKYQIAVTLFKYLVWKYLSSILIETFQQTDLMV